MTARTAISIPQPCHVSWAAMSPTQAGRHCATCATEVVDFTRLSEAEILALLARQGGRPVCAYVRTAQVTMPAPAGRWTRWLLAGLALLGWRLDAAAKPLPIPQLSVAAGRNEPAVAQVIVRGQVFDDQNHRPLQYARVIVKGTKYGAETDAQGRFELVMTANWAPLKSGTLALQVSGAVPFDFQTQDIKVDVRQPSPIELKITLQSQPDRGHLMGSIQRPEDLLAPPRK